MRPLTIALALGLVTAPSVVAAQSLEDYLQVRRQHGVRSAATPAGIDAFVGDRVIELRGEVGGTVGAEGSTLLIVSVVGGPQVLVRATTVPDWLGANRVNARLLVRARRASRTASLESELVAAAPERTIAAWEEAQRPSPTPPRAGPSRTRPTNQSSRSGRRPSPMPGDIPREVAPPVTKQVAVPERLIALVPAYADFIRRQNPRLSPDKAQHIAETILAFSAARGVDARLVVALVLAESTFRPETTSHKGAMGLGQLMPGTARMLGVTDAYDTEQNLYGTVKLLRQHLDTYIAKTGDTFEGLVLALAAYNAGPGAVRRHGGVPPFRETQNYVRRVVETYRRLTGEVE